MSSATNPAEMSGRESLDPLVELVRDFNRFYTGLIGVLDRGYLDTPYSLQEARVLYEVGTAPGSTAKEVRSRTGFDQGYLSRLVARLATAGLVRRTASQTDGRVQHLFLAPSGKRAFRTLNHRANAQVATLLGSLGNDERRDLVASLRTARHLLDPAASLEPFTIREQRVGDLGWTLHRQSLVYKSEFGYKDAFETYLCEGLAPYLRNYDPRRDRLWVGESAGRPMGFIAIHHVEDRPRWAKLRWFLVEREARGRGLGSRLLSTAIGFCRKAGYDGIFLWTVSDLDGARTLYERAGFLLTEEKKECAWAPWAREQRWELRLRRKAG